MHIEAYEGFGTLLIAAGRSHNALDDDGRTLRILDIGGIDRSQVGLNVQDYFTNFDWTVLDIEDGPGVDIVADATTWQPDRQYDIVVCTEVLEHVQCWEDIILTAAVALGHQGSGGVLLRTCAAPPRPPHGATGGEKPDDEWYSNVSPDSLANEAAAYFTDYGLMYRRDPGDVYFYGVR